MERKGKESMFGHSDNEDGYEEKRSEGLYLLDWYMG